MFLYRFQVYLTAFLLLFASSVTIAAVPAWQMVPTESTLTFTATQNGSPVSGQFNTFTGDINFDPVQPAASHIRIVVDTGSVSTSYKEVGDTLKTPDWFDVKLFPQAVFTAANFTKTGDNTWQANGSLTIRDKSVPITLTFVLEEYSSTKARAKGKTTLKRTMFGVGKGDWAKTDQVKDDVEVDFTVTAVKK